MKITQESDYALRIVQYLANQEESRVGASIIAKDQDVPLRFALKILRKLRQKDLIKSFMGVKGGYVLNKKAKDLTDDELSRIRKEVDKYLTEGDLRREINLNIKTKMEINSYQGTRHKKNLPVRGQRTSRNARTRKGKGKVVANKKK